MSGNVMCVVRRPPVMPWRMFAARLHERVSVHPAKLIPRGTHIFIVPPEQVQKRVTSDITAEVDKLMVGFGDGDASSNGDASSSEIPRS